MQRLAETPDVRLRRLRMRSARRGMREMDLILGPFADATLQALSLEEIDAYETVLSENDQDLYKWICGRDKVPTAHEAIVGRVKTFLAARMS